MKKEKKTSAIFRINDWVATTEIEPNPGQKYTNAQVKKIKNHGEMLFVIYGAYQDTRWITAKSCTLVRRI